jgi:type II secretory pathway component GspD/PulD (secretin)
MRNSLRLFVFIFSFCLFLPHLNAESELPYFNPEATISMDFKDANLKDILKIFSMQSGLNFIASEAVQDRKLTLYMDKVPIKEVMDKLFKANNLTYEFDETANIFSVKDWGKPELELVTKVYYLKYRSVPSARLQKERDSLLTNPSTGADILNSIKQVLSKDGKIAEDTSTNSLIITDVPSRFSAIDGIITALDIPQPQVMLDVEILDVRKDVVDRMGFEFNNNPFTFIVRGGGSKITKYFGAATRGAVGAVTFGTTYTQTLDFLRTQSDTKYLARPRLLTLNNETAEITITKDEVVGTEETINRDSSGNILSTDRKYIRSTDLSLTKEGTGIFVRVTPQINSDTNEITLVINPKSSITNSNAVWSTQADAELRSTKSIVKIRDGETVILGGLIHKDKSLVEKKLPILGDIPFIGLLFRHKNQSKDIERELIVFITPHIIKETSMAYATEKKVSLSEKDQSKTLAFDRLVAINANLDNLEKTKE